MYAKYLLQSRFAFFISLFDLSAILKIRNGEHAHYVGLVDAYTWNREKQMFVALGKDLICISMISRSSGRAGLVSFGVTSMNSDQNSTTQS